ncbi:MAG: hypothetical protein CL792_05725 [Chloroflexi bacterium]|nr:hypothetical protein [Chloroflexota bacterium]|tara:strand:+ start:11819 stop:12448 length:630 start_codon:yes stop_codon:yes gene_type:complete
MIVGITGRLVQWNIDSSVAWIEAGGLSYEVFIPAFAQEWLSGNTIDQELKLFTYYHVTERQPTPLLIGFASFAEREFFRKIIDVPDFGPVKAVRALTFPINEIAQWIESGDRQALRQLPGVGERLSQTLIANLQGKLIEEAQVYVKDDADGSNILMANQLMEDAIEALTTLQYSQRESEQLVISALRSDTELKSLEELLVYILENQVPT